MKSGRREIESRFCADLLTKFMNKLTVGSLFSGIGGLDKGLEDAGMETVWQVEFDEWCRERLVENFPHTEKFKDVKEVGKHNLKPVDIIAGGFPCQDISSAKDSGLGLDGKRSGLWSEYSRIIRELRPRYALIENVAKLTFRGLDRVLSDLAASGYDAEWQTIQAQSFGLPHKRERLFIIAYASGIRRFQYAVFKKINTKDFRHKRTTTPELPLKVARYSFAQIPEHLRVDNGVSFELSEIENAVKGYGNAVAVPVAKWLGEQIIRFDNESHSN